jgi:hypothetical protein
MQTKANSEDRAPSAFTTTMQSTLLLCFTLFLLSFMSVLVHEGAHALSDLAHGVGVRLFYAHPLVLVLTLATYQPHTWKGRT